MLKTRIAVFVSGGGTNLQALLDAQAAGKIPSGEIVLVAASNPIFLLLYQIMLIIFYFMILYFIYIYPLNLF